MSLVVHLLIHVFFSLLAGWIAWRLWRKPIPAFTFALLGGVFIDLDHLIDYFLAFGPTFDLPSFLRGDQFLSSNRIFVLFHGWEYGILLLAGTIFFANKRLKSAFFALCLGMIFHLAVDGQLNDGMTVRSYSLFYRAVNNFSLEKTVTPEHWEAHQKKREQMLIIKTGT